MKASLAPAPHTKHQCVSMNYAQDKVPKAERLHFKRDERHNVGSQKNVRFYNH